MSVGKDPTVTLAAPGAPAAGRRYFLVFDQGTSRVADLPEVGSLILGRAPEAGLRLREPAASRRHACLEASYAQVRLRDLDSHNGTLVNGARLQAGELRVLRAGDVITIGEASLVLCCPPEAQKVRPVRDEAALRERLEEELDRAHGYEDRPLGVLCIELGGLPDPAALLGALCGALRILDVLALTEGGQALVLLPEMEAEEATETCARLVSAAATVWPQARGGLATCPGDGDDAAALLSLARGAAAKAAPGRVLPAGDSAAVMTVGDAQVVVAEPSMVRIFELIGKIAATDLPVLVCGETGTGKEVVAKALHERSQRARGRLLSLNCAALPESLVEAELFGYERGAFSGAAASKAGLLESAQGGTVFLDEVGELPLQVQAKLLRVLDTLRLTRLGDLRERELDLRIVAATNRDLEAEVRAGRFRQDLLFRLSGATVHLPPLRDRRRELPILARMFLADACKRGGREAMSISPGAMALLLAYSWPGNLRELRHLMELLCATVPAATPAIIEPWHVAERLRGQTESGPTPTGGAPVRAGQGMRPINEEIQELERRRMAEALAATGGHHRRAAELIGMPQRTFATKFKKYGLKGGS
jgi:DNA-binding NtrC family response regulator/pSer/pThr/pTyr-binding forkhead associated (FHA) protein